MPVHYYPSDLTGLWINPEVPGDDDPAELTTTEIKTTEILGEEPSDSYPSTTSTVDISPDEPTDPPGSASPGSAPGSTMTDGPVTAEDLKSVTETIYYSGITIMPLFEEITTPSFTNLSSTLTTSAENINGHTVPFITGPGGVGWTCIFSSGGGDVAVPSFPSIILFPTTPPESVALMIPKMMIE